MNADELTTLNDQIAGMARAGLPLDEGLASLAREMGRGRLRRVTDALVEDLRAGKTLPEALEQRKGELPPYYASLAEAGLRTGRLPEVLRTLTDYARTVAQTRAIVIEAFLYPAVVLGLALVLFFVMSSYVLPQFEEIFQDFRLSLPLVTKGVLAIGRDAWTRLGLPLVVLAGLLVLVRVWMRYTERGRRAWTQVIYVIPLVGTLVRSARLASFVELMAILVEHSVPLPEAMQLAADASSDPYLSGQAQVVRARLENGDPLGVALKGRGLLPEWVAWMTLAGERRGALPATLYQVAASYRRSVETRANVLRNVLPTFVIICTAAVLAGAFILAMVLPLVNLIEGLSK
jgi:general secretion pathway protein F